MSLRDLTSTLHLTNARIVVLITNGGGAIVEHRDVEYTEGRVVTCFGEDEPPQLRFMYWFNVLGTRPADTLELTPARIIIEGDCEGQRIEIRGRGHFGYGEFGNPEGEFSRAPVILLEKVQEDDVPGAPDMPLDEWRKHMDSIEPVPSPDYVRAVRGRGTHKRMED